MTTALTARPRVRLLWLHLASRRVPAAVFVAAALAVVLRIALHWLRDTGNPDRLVPLLIETGVAAAVGAATRSPFGEPERATGGYLPVLRLLAALGVVAVGAGALVAGAAAGHLPDGTLVVLRDYLGLAGVALLAATVLGGNLAWTGPLTYTVLCAIGLDAGWTTLWLWPLRGSTDRGALACGLSLLVVGVAVVTVRGARESGST
jgi:hypothetical protein